MVKHALILLAVLVLALAAAVQGMASAQIVYIVDHEWAQIFINQDGTIDLIYNITLTTVSGTIHGFYVGQPKSDFTIGQAVDQYGNSLGVTDASSSGDYRVDVTLNQPLTSGNSVWFTVTTNVAGLISNDTTNPGNFGMQYVPQWISDVPINDVRIQIVLPQGVTLVMLKLQRTFTTEHSWLKAIWLFTGKNL